MLSELLLIVLCVVVIWSDSVGDIHLWKDPIPWNPPHGSPERTTERTETGETRQRSLH